MVVLRVFDVDPGTGPIHPNRMGRSGPESTVCRGLVWSLQRLYGRSRRTRQGSTDIGTATEYCSELLVLV
ncbi:MAG: hypothetical protein IPQ10_11565 [Saprospiraceae bacterium]|nr:hypothetical protein [Saprospiraceae bacterium]